MQRYIRFLLYNTILRPQSKSVIVALCYVGGRIVKALTPAGVPGHDGAGAGLICHGDHGHDDCGRGEEGQLVVHCRFRGSRSDATPDRSTSLLYPRISLSFFLGRTLKSALSIHSQSHSLHVRKSFFPLSDL